MSETALTPPDETTPPAAPANMFLDEDAPRLGSAPLTAPSPMGGAGTPTVSESAVPSLPVVSPVLSDPSAPMQSGGDPATPTLATPPTPTLATPPTPTLAATPTPPAANLAPAAPPAPTPTPTIAEAAAPSIPTPMLPSLPTAAAATPSSDTDTDTETVAGDGEHPMAHLMGGASKPSEASRRAAELRAEKKAKAKKMKIGFAVGALVVSAVVGPPLWSWFTNALNEAGNVSTEQPAD